MKKVCLLAACVLALFSCQKEQNVPEEDGLVPKGYTKLTLKAVSDVTKTTLTLDEGGETGTVKWAAEDKIKVICDDGPVTDPFEIVDGVGTTDGSFAGYIPDGKTAHHTVYPAASFSAVSGTTVKVVVPASQSGDFGSCNIAVANVAADHSMAFKNVNAFISFTVPDGVTKVVVSSVDESPLAGTLSVDCSGTYPAATTTYESTASSITATLAGTAGTYYVSALPGEEHEKGLLFEYYEGETKTGTYWLNKKITTGVNNVYGMGEVSTSGDYYVTVDGGASVKNGMSWATAWSALQFWSKIHPAGSDTAIDNAKLANINGATFHFAAGTYKWGPDAAINIDESETVSFIIKGGYNASTGARDIATNKTIFSGDDGGDGAGDHRILSLSGNMDVTFDGVCFEKGYIGTTTDGSNGAGVMITGGSWLFQDCSFSGNTVFSNSTGTRSGEGYSGYGGAIAIRGGSLTVNGGSFSGNMAWRGGAIWNNTTTGSVTITGASFTGNGSKETTRNGGAVYAERSTTFNNCTMDGNKALYAGAIATASNGNVSHINGGIYRNNVATGGGALNVDTNTALLVGKYNDTPTSFQNNTADTGNGGAILFETNQNDDAHANIIEGALFEGNQAGDQGGAIYLTNNRAQLQIKDCTFDRCHSTTNGGAITISAGTVSDGKSSAQIRISGTKFTGNYSRRGGVWYSTNKPDVFIDRCSFEDNYFTYRYGIFTSDGANHLCFNNCSFEGNYTSNSSTDDQKYQYPSWLCIDDMQSGGVFSMSNCTIIGNVQYSADGGETFTALTNGTALVRLWHDSQTNYFTNNIIVPENGSIAAIKGQESSVAVNLSYNHTGTISTVTTSASEHNVNGLTKASLDNPSWNDGGYWTWNGTFSGVAPTKTNYSDFNTRITGISSRFQEWLSTNNNIKKDARGETRSDDSWWPGAYQN